MTKAAAAKTWELNSWTDNTKRSYPEGSQSILFNGALAGTSDGQTSDNWYDRIRLAIDANIPANIGAGDFTVEMWLRPAATNGNGATNVTAGANITWIYGNIFFDRDLYSENQSWGMSITQDGFLAFGTRDASNVQRTIVGTTDVTDDAWHHVAFTRDQSTGEMAIYLDGSREVTGTGGTGSLACPVPEPDSEPYGTTGQNRFMVLGCEKHDESPNLNHPGYYGYMTEVRLSDSIRYTGTTYTEPTARFTTDGNTAWLASFQEASGTTITDDSGNGADATLEQGGAGSYPRRSEATPF